MSEIETYYDISKFSNDHIKMLRLANKLGKNGFSERAAEYDKSATFPQQNYQELADNGFLKLVIPKENGGFGFSLAEYATIGAEIGKYCGATALTFNMHTSSMLWSRFMYEMPNLTVQQKKEFQKMREKQFKNVVEQNALYSQPISEGGNNWTSDPIKTNCVKVDGGWIINGIKKFTSLAGY